MKKVLVLVLALILTLGLASVSMASTVYLDVMADGKVDDGTVYDLSQTSIGLDMPQDEFKFGFDYSNGTIDINSYDVDTFSFFLKGGYALIDDKQLRLDVTAGYYDRDLDFNNGLELSSYSFMLGFDAKLNLDKKAWLDFSYSFALAPEVKLSTPNGSDSGDLDSISLLNCKFNFLLTNEFGGSFGYRSETLEGGSDEMTFSGFTLGVFYKF